MDLAPCKVIFSKKVFLEREAQLKMYRRISIQPQIHLTPSKHRVCPRPNLNRLIAANLTALTWVDIRKLGVPAPEHLQIGFMGTQTQLILILLVQRQDVDKQGRNFTRTFDGEIFGLELIYE